MKQRLTGWAVAAVAAVTATAALTACGPQPPGELRAADVQRVQVREADYAAQIRQLSDAALSLGARLVASGGAGNVVTSPASLLVALAMLRAGASGPTADEMDAVIGLPPQGRDEAMNAVLASLSPYDGDPGSVGGKEPPAKPLVHLADGAFVDRGQPTGKEYLRILAEQYGAGVYPVDFAAESATKGQIDAWVSKNTGGRITEAPANYRPENTFSLLNAAFFAAPWQTPFSADNTQDADFTTPQGARIRVPFMNGSLSLKYAEGAGWRAVELPYKDGFAMRLVLPSSGSDLPLSAAVTRDIAAALAAAQPAAVELSLPKWNHSSTTDLQPILASMGLDITLGPDPDFHLIQPTMVISAAAQAAVISVAEKGTVAAGVSQFNGVAVSGQARVDVLHLALDRPFSYQVVQQSSGLPLFMGQVADPR